MSVVLIAPEGMLGRACAEHLDREGVAYQGVSRPDIDVTSSESVRAALKGASVVLNCSAFTDVDGAETREDEATEVNGEGVRHLAEACLAEDALLVHVSTDYVFPGHADAPYPVDAALDPINAYGRSKAAGEEAIRTTGTRHLIVRTSWLYAPWGTNFVRTMAKLAAERDTLRVVNDQRGRPTSAQHLARVMWGLVQAKVEGTFHGTDGGEATWFDLASHVVGRVRPACRVDPCSTDEFPRPAPRPSYSVLDLAPIEAVLGPMTPWRSNVDAVLEQL
ncbi:MAG: dTDP-4-dehydrorhamnose reductase [Myxococcota bacterium]